VSSPLLFLSPRKISARLKLCYRRLNNNCDYLVYRMPTGSHRSFHILPPNFQSLGSYEMQNTPQMPLKHLRDLEHLLAGREDWAGTNLAPRVSHPVVVEHFKPLSCYAYDPVSSNRTWFCAHASPNILATWSKVVPFLASSSSLSQLFSGSVAVRTGHHCQRLNLCTLRSSLWMIWRSRRGSTLATKGSNTQDWSSSNERTESDRLESASLLAVASRRSSMSEIGMGWYNHTLACGFNAVSCLDNDPVLLAKSSSLGVQVNCARFKTCC
jgi:hypothetical protein